MIDGKGVRQSVSDRVDLDQIAEGCEVVGVAGVERQLFRARGSMPWLIGASRSARNVLATV